MQSLRNNLLPLITLVAFCAALLMAWAWFATGRGEVHAAYTVANSARFISGNSDNLTKTLTTPTSQNIFTFSAWVKRAKLGSLQNIFGVSTNYSFGFPAADTLVVTIAGTAAATTPGLYRDPAVWMHVVYVQNGTAITIYVNGVSVATGTGTNSQFNTAVAHQIGSSNSTNFFDGYLSDVYFVDGQALTPTSFGQTDPNGYWRPLSYTGTYGTNGFKLAFGSGHALGTDTGSSNNWATSTNMTAALNQLTDTPTNSFATGNPISPGGSPTYTQGNLVSSGAATSTIFMSTGKWYWEVTAKAAGASSGVTSATGANVITSVTNNTTTGFQFDADAGTLASTTGSGFVGTVSGLTGGRFAYATGGSNLFIFGAGGTTTLTTDSTAGGAFYFTPTSGFKALSTANLPVPTIAQPNLYFNAQIYKGTGAAIAVNTTNTQTKTVFLTSGTSYTVPSDFNSNSNTIELIGGGGGGAQSNSGTGGGAGGGGGGYSKISNLSLTAGASVTYQVGTGGAGGASDAAAGSNGTDTYFCNSTSNCATIAGTAVQVGAKAGLGGASGASATPGKGGEQTGNTGGIGTTKNLGGTAGTVNIGGSGGGGAAGLTGDGKTGGNTTSGSGQSSGAGGGGANAGSATNGSDGSAAAGTGGAGGTGTTGTAGGAGGVGSAGAGAAGSNGSGGGGGAGSTGVGGNGGAGGAGTEWDSTHGSGGGGGGGGAGNAAGSGTGGAGALYGGGGGGGGYPGGGTSGPGAAGGAGLIVITYTPSASTFTPDLVWIKDRTSATSSLLFDAVRTATKYLSSDSGNAERTAANSLTAFLTNGFSLGAASTAGYNLSGNNYISWMWRESVTAGFDIVTYAGSASNQNIAHNLGAVPELMILKSLTTDGSTWLVYHSKMNATPASGALFLSLTDAFTASATYWNSTAPTSAQFTLGGNSAANTAGQNYVGYLFAGVDGFSKFGSYTGNAAADGPFIYTGFKPRYILIKSSTAVDAWLTYDTARDTYNVAGTTLVPNTTAADATISGIDFLSNGFKLRTITTTPNAAQTYIYAAFADVPFYYSAQPAATAFVQAVAFLMGMTF